MVMPAGKRRHLVSLYALGAAVPDLDGGFTQAVVALTPPTAWASIVPATQRDLERATSGTVMSEASHIITLPYHAQVSTNTVILYNGRQFNVAGLANPEERGIETIAICTEVLNAPAVVAESSWIQAGWIQ